MARNLRRTAHDRDRDILTAVATVDWWHEVYTSAMISERLTELGITLPSVAPPGRQLHRLRDRRQHRLLGRARCDAGCHTRTTVGMAELPFDIAVEIEMIARVWD